MERIILASTAMLLAAWPIGAQAGGIARGAHYVAMGSSFASGPGVTKSADDPPNRCTRSQDNYPRQLARALKLNLTDVSCSGAMVPNITGKWAELPAQIDAVTPETRLVTITIGGNDVGYSGRLISQSCEAVREQADAAPEALAFCKGFPPPTMFPQPTDANFERLENNYIAAIAAIRAKAPQARIVLVQYLAALPPSGGCAALPISADHAALSRMVAARVADVTARVAKASGAALVEAMTLSADHTVCSAKPWVFGFPVAKGPKVVIPYHPNLDGMTALAKAIRNVLK